MLNKPIPGGCKLVQHLYVRDSVCVDRCGTVHNLPGHVLQKFFFVGSLLAQISALLLSALSIYNKQQCTTT
jgi:hypothetical protein